MTTREFRLNKLLEIYTQAKNSIELNNARVMIYGAGSCPRCSMPRWTHNEHDWIRCYLQ